MLGRGGDQKKREERVRKVGAGGRRHCRCCWSLFCLDLRRPTPVGVASADELMTEELAEKLTDGISQSMSQLVN